MAAPATGSAASSGLSLLTSALGGPAGGVLSGALDPSVITAALGQSPDFLSDSGDLSVSTTLSSPVIINSPGTRLSSEPIEEFEKRKAQDAALQKVSSSNGDQRVLIIGAAGFAILGLLIVLQGK